MISTIIIKPTKNCNADCSYCSSPPDLLGAWDVERFKVVFDRMQPSLENDATIIWHGGEPMLLGPKFYIESFAYAKSIHPGIRFSIQTNLLLYKSRLWKSVFSDVFNGAISTSYDPDERNRTIKGSSSKYSAQFHKKIQEVISDGYRPLVIGTYTEETKGLAVSLYEKSKSLKENGYSLRFNYRYPAGRDMGKGVAISPIEYGEMLIDLYDRWIKDIPDILITPLDQMLLKCIDPTVSTCPWTKACGGKIISIDPNGDIFNCGEFSDLGNHEYKFGNAFTGEIGSPVGSKTLNIVKRSKGVEYFGSEILGSDAARKMIRRRFDHPFDCKTCRHYRECEGGCMRDSELYERGLGGKFFYCASWKMVFDRIKSSIISGEARGVIEKLGYSFDDVSTNVRSNLSYLVD